MKHAFSSSFACSLCTFMSQIDCLGPWGNSSHHTLEARKAVKAKPCTHCSWEQKTQESPEECQQDSLLWFCSIEAAATSTTETSHSAGLFLHRAVFRISIWLHDDTRLTTGSRTCRLPHMLIWGRYTRWDHPCVDFRSCMAFKDLILHTEMFVFLPSFWP